MKRIFLWLVAALSVSLSSCNKQQTDPERSAEVERQVQERLAAEHQTAEQQQLAQRQAELDAREKVLADQENRVTPAPTPNEPVAQSTAEDSETDSYSTFYRKLEPYGDWIETGAYGYVWQPRVAAQPNEWRPYTNGHWIYTDAGWTWISDEPFGWATYHYGRWVRLQSAGWVWVPGDQWAPAWVSWRKGNDYVGWAPLPPEAEFDRQTGIQNWADNYYDIGPDLYAFVPANEFGSKLSSRTIVPTARNVTIINQTTNVTNITYNNSVVVDRGPSYDDLRARSRHPIERLRLERTQDLTNERPVIRGEVVALPAPEIRPGTRTARPRKVVRTIAQSTVERGWSGVSDAQKVRAKMQSEATPPPNLPAKPVVRQDRQVIPPRSAATPAAATTPSASPPLSDAAQPSPAENVVAPKEADWNRREAAKAAEHARERQRQLEKEQRMQQPRRNQPNESPAPGATASPTAAPSATPSATAATSPPATQPPLNLRQNRRQGRSQRQEQRRAEREQRMQAGPENSPNESPAPTATPSPVGTPVASASPSPTESKAEQRNRRRQERRAAARQEVRPETSPEPTAEEQPSATPR